MISELREKLIVMFDAARKEGLRDSQGGEHSPYSDADADYVLLLVKGYIEKDICPSCGAYKEFYKKQMGEEEVKPCVSL